MMWHWLTMVAFSSQAEQEMLEMVPAVPMTSNLQELPVTSEQHQVLDTVATAALSSDIQEPPLTAKPMPSGLQEHL